MDLYAVLLPFLFVFFVLFLYVRWNDNYWLKRGIPFIEPGKIFGNIREVVLMRKTIGQVYREIYKKLGDKPLGGFFKLRQPMLMIKDPELIKEVLSDKFDSFNSNDINVRRDTSPILKMNPLLSSGATWRASKSVLTPLTHDKTLDGMFEISKIISQDMVTTMKIHPLLPVECKKLSARYITNVIASCALGMETSTFKKENPEFSEMSSKIFRNTLKSNIALLFALYAPNLSNLFLYRFIPQKISQYFINMISNMCKYRVKESVERKDFLQHLININKESEANGEGTVYNYDKITAYCMTILLNGYFMSNSPLYYCLYEIASNNEIQKKLKNELKENNVRTMEELSSEKMKRLKYLDMVFSETLRLHPPVQVITRLCNKETVLKKDGIEYKIEPGTPVTIPIYALHMDQKHYKDPERFLPERFTEDAFKGDFTYLPFGRGPRECPGARFGVMVIKIALVAILLKFTIELRDPSMELKQDPRSSLLNSAQGEVLLTLREKESRIACPIMYLPSSVTKINLSEIVSDAK